MHGIDEQQAAALKEYLESRPEIFSVAIDVGRQLLVARLAPRTFTWEVEDAAAAAGFAIERKRSPLDSTDGRIEVALLGITTVATALSFAGSRYNFITGQAAELLGLFIALICGYTILKKALMKVFDKKFDMDVLVGIAILSPLYYSFMTGRPLYYPAGVIIFIVLAASIFNRYIEPRFEELYFFLPSVAMKEGEKEPWVELKDVKAGDVLLAKPGFRVPADGNVIKGSATVTPVDTCASNQIREGMQAEAGSLVESGELSLRVAKEGGSSRLKGAAEALRNARERVEVMLSYPRAIERILLLVSLLGTAFAVLFMNSPGAAAGILLLATPCAMFIARPLSLLASGMSASRQGAAFESHGSIERMSMTDTVVFDGLASVVESSTLSDVMAAPGHADEEVKSIVSAYQADDPTFREAKGFADGCSLLSLSEASRSMTIPEELLRRARSFESKGKLVRFAFKGQALAGAAAFELSVPDNLKSSIERMGKIKGLTIMLISAEPPGAPEAVAKAAGIQAVRPRMRESERLEYLQKLGSDGKNVLAAGRGCDLSRFAANAAAVTIERPMSGFEGLEDAICRSPAEVYGLLSLARKAVKRTNEGMSFGLYFNTFAIVAASTGLIDLELALLMVVASVAVVATNSARLYFTGLR